MALFVCEQQRDGYGAMPFSFCSHEQCTKSAFRKIVEFTWIMDGAMCQ